MTPTPVVAVPFDETADLTLHELVRVSGLAEAQLVELVRYGALVPRDAGATTLTFEARWVVVARRARRLCRDFDLDPHGASLALSLLERIEGLKREIERLRAGAL